MSIDNAAIAHEHYFTAQEGVNGSYSHGAPQHAVLKNIAICVVTFTNGYCIVGSSGITNPCLIESERNAMAKDNAMAQLKTKTHSDLFDIYSDYAESMK